MDLTTIDHLLTTTRSVRKRLDLMRPVEPEVIEHCIEIALQAPTGSNLQGWHFLVVADAAKRAALADLYRQAHIAYYNMQQAQPPQYRQDDLRARQRARVGASSLYLREYLHAVPLYIIPCIKERMAEVPHLAALAQYETLYHATIYGSIFPAVWSLMLALRARGLGSSLTTLHLMYAREPQPSWTSPTMLGKWRSSRWRTSRARISSPPSVCLPVRSPPGTAGGRGGRDLSTAVWRGKVAQVVEGTAEEVIGITMATRPDCAEHWCAGDGCQRPLRPAASRA
jgi:nitroreductase